MRAKSLAAASLFILAACQTDIGAEVYTADLEEVAKDSKLVVTTPASITAEVLSVDQCEKSRDKVQAVLAPYFPTLSGIRCERIGSNGQLVISFDMVVFNWKGLTEKEIESPANLSAVFGYVVHEEGNATFGVGVLVDQANALLSDIQREFLVKPKLRDIGFQFALNNDQRDDKTVAMSNVFLNGDPVYREKEITLARREQALVRLSDVATQHALKNQNMAVFQVRLN